MTTQPTPEPGSLDEHLERLLAIETAAETIHGWHPTLMPGMLQTADYARASITASAPALAPEDVYRRAVARTARIDTLGRAEGRTARFVIAEEVLTRPVGGPAIIADQLDHLLALLALRPSLQVRVLPSRAATHPGLTGAFTQYQAPQQRSVVTENLTGTAVTSRPEGVLAYSLAYDRVEQRAVSPAASLRMIEAARNRLATA
ncbi:DUF5753 domain-containing protein [Streptomyces sp. R-74717]|uniref:DUF5753 domain-containing protein n=1 Tax=Streptomyces sp. R-74717 TaxID=2969820 RepID=UPI0039B6C8E8